MKKQQKAVERVTVFKRYTHKRYAAFASLKQQVRIGVLSIVTLSTVTLEKANAQPQAQQPATAADDERDVAEVVISGTLAPLTALQSARMVSVITRDEVQRAAVQSVNDLLKLASGVDVRQRGGFGIQTDISLNGGTFDQVTLLLNGVNINNPQTGHHTADLPCSVDDIERIEILEGANSRVYGGQAFGGAINIVTRQAAGKGVSLHAQGGSYGTWGTDAAGELTHRNTDHRLSGGYTQSNGGTVNSDFAIARAFYRGGSNLSGTRLNWQAGFNRKAYGANTFYSAAYPNQYEEQNRFIVSLSAETQGRIRLQPSAYWHRSTDNYQLIRGTDKGENFHRTDVFGASLRGYTDWWGGRTAVGTEIRNEGILSTNLGRPMDEHEHVHIPGGHGRRYNRQDNRTYVSFQLEHNIMLNRFSLSAGVLAQRYLPHDTHMRLYPGIDIAFTPVRQWRIYASWNMGVRQPTYTDLYYKSPTLEGNTGLRPEEVQSAIAGVRYTHCGLTVTAKGFYHRGRGLIDWVMYTPEDVYHATAFDLDNMGAQVQASANLSTLFNLQHPWIERLSAGYTYIHQNRHDNREIFKSNYALEYLRHKVTARLEHRIFGRLSAAWDFRWQQRTGAYLLYEHAQSTNRLVNYRPYATLDVKVQWKAPKYSLYVMASNLTDHTYYDLGNIPQPGIWVMAGARYNLNF